MKNHEQFDNKLKGLDNFETTRKNDTKYVPIVIPVKYGHAQWIDGATTTVDHLKGLSPDTCSDCYLISQQTVCRTFKVTTKPCLDYTSSVIVIGVICC